MGVGAGLGAGVPPRLTVGASDGVADGVVAAVAEGAGPLAEAPGVADGGASVGAVPQPARSAAIKTAARTRRGLADRQGLARRQREPRTRSSQPGLGASACMDAWWHGSRVERRWDPIAAGLSTARVGLEWAGGRATAANTERERRRTQSRP